MYTDESMLHRSFVKYFNTHEVTKVSYHSKSSSIVLEATFENPIAVSISEIKSIEQFTIVAVQKGIVKMAFKIKASVAKKSNKPDIQFLLETIDGEFEIVFRNS